MKKILRKILPKITLTKQLVIVVLILIVITPWQLLSTIKLPRIEPVDAATRSVSTRADFDSGYFNGTESKSKEGDLMLKTDGSWGPLSYKTPNLPMGDQTALASDGEYIYMLQSADNEFIRYLPAENRWQNLAVAPHYAYPGASLIKMGNYIYAIYGGYQREFSRYSIDTNTWTDLDNLPDLVYSGSALATDGSKIYALRGFNTGELWVYTPGSGWGTETTYTVTFTTGSAMVYYSGNLYVLRGGQRNIYRYNLTDHTWYTTTTGGQALNISPATFTGDHRIDIKDGVIYAARDANGTEFYSYDIGTNAWANLVVAPLATRYAGTVYNSSEPNNVYLFRGNNSYDFWKYDIQYNRFDGPAYLPYVAATGADLIYNSGYIYYNRGGGNNYYRYSVSGNSWETLTVSSVSYSDDAKGVAVGAYNYYLTSTNTNTFYRYDISGGDWEVLATTPAAARYGSALTYLDPYIYAVPGNNSNDVWRYTIGSPGSWDNTTVPNLPDNAESYYGSRMVSDGTSLFYITGAGRSQLLRWTPGDANWTVVTTLPFAPYYGTDAAYYLDGTTKKIVFQAGYYKSEVYEYLINEETWRRLPDLQSTYVYDIGPYGGGSLEVDPTSGKLYSITGNGYNYFNAFTPSDYNYPASGTWTSQTIDLTYASSYSSLTTSATVPGNATISFQARSSSDQSTWTGWETISNGVIPVGLTAQRYVQFKVTLNATSDRSQTPTLHSLTLNYVTDSSAPVPPESSTYSGKSQIANGITLTSGQSYSYLQPYFSWGAATESETAVNGYYVYYGTNPAATPLNDGVFQTTNNYLVTQSMTNDPSDPDDGVYYLIVQAVNTANLTSDAFTVFVYGYNSVSPPSELVASTSAHFSSGTNNQVNTANDRIKLQSQSGFWMEERLSLLPVTASYGTDLAHVSSTNKLYLMPSTSGTSSINRRIYEYDIASDTFTLKATNPNAIANGTAMTEGPDGILYAFRGGTNEFWSYNTGTDTWNDPVDPSNYSYVIGLGSDLAYDGDEYIYAIRGSNDDAFSRYNVDGDTWENLPNVDFGAPSAQYNNVVGSGGDLAIDSERNVYVIQGGARSGFARYTPSSETWTPLPNTPVLTTLGSRIAYDSTTNAIYLLGGANKNRFYKFDLSNQEWTQLPDAPAGIYVGSGMRVISGEIYVVRGNSTTFYKYDIAKASWQVPTVGIFGGAFRGTEYRTFQYGSNIVKGDGQNLYLSRGNFDNLFYRYNSVSGEATRMADAPFPFYYGSELTYDSVHNQIYATANLYYRKLFVYDIATDVWSEISDYPPPYDPLNSSAMAYDPVNNDLYWTRAGGNAQFYKYDLDALSNRWGSALSNVTGAPGWGGDLLYKNGKIYALRGADTLNFYSYDIATPGWETGGNDPADLPTGALIGNESFLVDGGDYLYTCRGNNQYACYRFSISGGTWEAIANAPANVYQGGSADTDGLNKILMIPGSGGTNTMNNGLHTYIMQTENSSFVREGSYTSPVHDLGTVYRYAGLKVDYQTATNSALIVSTRSSADNATWSDWQEATYQSLMDSTNYYKINSTANRYLQVKFALTSSDGIYSVTVDDYTVEYYSDTDKPENPLTIDAYLGASRSATLTTNTWYNHAAPLFDWPDAEATSGATDNVVSGKIGSGVAGYYVAFETESDVNASESGTLVTASQYTPSNLVSGETYYLRIQAVDSAGNFSATNWQPFIYKYDNTPPDNPVTITVDPSGYSTVNNYSFTLKGAADDSSTIASYCYKYKTAPAVFTQEVCTPTMDANYTATISGVLAYDNGDSNTFYVKAKDGAGNLAASYATTAYKYSMDAPGPPTNLRVTYPADSNTNSRNEFAFAWDPPEPGSFNGTADSLRYYYWIGPSPSEGTAENEVGLSSTTLARGAYATDTGTNRLYVVAKDEAGNIDYENYAMVTFVSDTSAPGAPRNLDISDVSIKETEAWRLALTWDTPVSTGSGVTEYQVFRSDTEDAVCPANPMDSALFERVNSPTQTSYVDPELTQTTKYYCVRACNYANGKGCGVASSTVHMYPDGRWRVAPELTASPSAVVKTKSATITWSTNRTSNSFIQYGTASGDYGEETGSSTQVTAHSVDLTGLEPGVTYFFKAIWTDEDGNSGSSNEITFTTNPAPVVSTVKTSNVSIYGAYVSFTISNAIKATVEYGKTLSYGGTETISTAKNESTYTISLQSLVEGTDYNFRIKAEDDEGNVYYSDNYTFETLPVPKITALKVQQVVGMPTATLRLIWTTNTSVSSIVTYYPSKNPERARDFVNVALKKSHEAIIRDLQDETEYTLVVTGKDAVGNQAEYPVQKVTTATDFRAPLIQNFSIETTITGIGDEARAKLVITWDTDEPSTTQVEYGQGTTGAYSQTTQEDRGLTSNHMVTVTGLVPSTIYHLRAISKDTAKNAARSEDTVIITPKSTKGALELVVDNLSKSFGFLKGVNVK